MDRSPAGEGWLGVVADGGDALIGAAMDRLVA